MVSSSAWGPVALIPLRATAAGDTVFFVAKAEIIFRRNAVRSDGLESVAPCYLSKSKDDAIIVAQWQKRLHVRLPAAKAKA